MCGIVGIYSNKDIAKELLLLIYIQFNIEAKKVVEWQYTNGDNINYKKRYGLSWRCI